MRKLCRIFLRSEFLKKLVKSRKKIDEFGVVTRKAERSDDTPPPPDTHKSTYEVLE